MFILHVQVPNKTYNTAPFYETGKLLENHISNRTHDKSKTTHLTLLRLKPSSYTAYNYHSSTVSPETKWKKMTRQSYLSPVANAKEKGGSVFHINNYSCKNLFIWC